MRSNLVGLSDTRLCLPYQYINMDLNLLKSEDTCYTNKAAGIQKNSIFNTITIQWQLVQHHSITLPQHVGSIPSHSSNKRAIGLIIPCHKQ